MTYFGPMTAIVALVLVVLLIVGLAIIVRSVISRTSARNIKVCSRCRNANPFHAKFCANCGQKLNP